MCLAIPGEILEITGDESFMKSGRVSFAGIVKKVNLSFVPDAKIGDFVLVHAGFAINTIDKTEADRVFEYIEDIGDNAGSQGD